MILESHIRVKVNSTTYDYWIGKGYAVPFHIDSKGRQKKFKRGVSWLEVKVTDLPPKSNAQVTAVCATCNASRTLAFSQYSEVCWQCNLSKQKGAAHPRYLHRVKTSSHRSFDLYLRRKFNTTADTYFAILEKQDYKCATCGTPQSKEGRRFCLDHDHVTGKVRGILCQPCNTALGLLKDNVSTLSNLINYLGVNNGKD